MQIKQILLAGIVLSINLFPSTAQDSDAVIIGKVTDKSGEPLAGALVKILNTGISALADADGIYKLQKVNPGKYTIQIFSIGMKAFQKEIEIGNGQVVELDFQLSSESKQMKEVLVTGKSRLQKVSEQAFSVTAIDAKALHNTSQDLNQVLGKSAGIRIREDGGLGSNFNFSLNGFSGRQVRFFMDGIPMDNFGSALSLNNIPVNLAERIEIYKGVVPIWLGADALGGAVNIVTNNLSRNYLDVSYSYGSFNTHRTAISGAYTNPKTGWLISANIFQNYSDNNYWVNTGITDLQTKVISEPRKVRRFHDQYNSESVQLETGLSGKKIADKLLLGLILAQNHKDIQTAAQMSKVFGGWHQNSTTVMPTFKYQKDNFWARGLNFRAYGSYNFGHTQNVDTLNRFYNWTGEYQENSTNSSGSYVPGGENSRSLYKFRNNSAVANASLSYTLSPNHSIGANYVFSNFDRKGSDVLKPNEEAYRHPQTLQKHNLGFGYKYDFQNQISVSVFVKQYILQAKSFERVDIYTNPHWAPVDNQLSSAGYGIAGSYYPLKSLQLKVSFEKTYRMPEGDEMFGDGINHTSNKKLKPESSQNANIGFVWNQKLNDRHKLLLEGGFIYRNASDFIRTDILDTRTQSVNIRGVQNIGFDAQVQYSYEKWIVTGANITYQSLINTTKYETPGSNVVSTTYKDQIPNVPYLYGNANLGLDFSALGLSKNAFSLTYYLNYVASYYLKWPSLGYSWEKNEIPEQLSHDLSLSYSLKNGRYNLSADCRNLTDARLYDNFLMQKPGRAVYLKLRYFIRK